MCNHSSLLQVFLYRLILKFEDQIMVILSFCTFLPLPVFSEPSSHLFPLELARLYYALFPAPPPFSIK